MGVLVAGLAIPFAAVTGLVDPRRSPTAWTRCPPTSTAEPLAQRTRLLGSDGAVLATLYDQNRVNVPLAEVAPIMRKAIISIEDYRFYQHGALDLRGTLRAFVTNQAASDGTQGGSSITQQMVKMTLVNQAKTEAEQRGGDRRHLPAQDQRAALRDRLRGEVLQGLDPGALPQHRLLRRRRLRHRGGLAALLLRPRPGSTSRRPRCSPGMVKNPTGYDPTNDPDRGPRPPQHGAGAGWPSST